MGSWASTQEPRSTQSYRKLCMCLREIILNRGETPTLCHPCSSSPTSQLSIMSAYIHKLTFLYRHSSVSTLSVSTPRAGVPLLDDLHVITVRVIRSLFFPLPLLLFSMRKEGWWRRKEGWWRRQVHREKQMQERRAVK